MLPCSIDTMPLFRILRATPYNLYSITWCNITFSLSTKFSNIHYFIYLYLTDYL